jgi:hypothetical protein
MSNVINCIRISHHDNYAWMVTTKDKYYGEVVAGKEFKRESQNYDLSVNWLVIDVIDENRETLEKELIGSVQRYTANEQLKFEELDTYAQQLALENHVQQLIARGAFGHKIFKSFRERLVELINQNEQLDRTFETVKIGMMLRYVKTPPCLTNENEGYIPVERVKSGEFKIGLTESEFTELQKNLWFGENLIRNIHTFLLTEYAGRDYIKQQKENELIQKYVEQEKLKADGTADTTETVQRYTPKGKKSSAKAETTTSKESPELLTGDDTEQDEKKVVEML